MLTCYRMLSICEVVFRGVWQLTSAECVLGRAMKSCFAAESMHLPTQQGTQITKALTFGSVDSAMSFMWLYILLLLICLGSL